MARPAALLRWTGRGVIADLLSSVDYMMKDRGIKGHCRAFGSTIVVEGPDPTLVCATFESLPGLAWTAAGYAARGRRDMAEASRTLARHYLREGTRFSVSPEVSGEGHPSDLGGAVTSAMLEAVKGARASLQRQRVNFRTALDGSQGAVGVEISVGPGGVPTGRSNVSCLVSGGRHSSVVAWHAVLSGFRVRLVHFKVDDESLLAVARLYSELSFRSDPRGLSLLVIEGTMSRDMVAQVSRPGELLFSGLNYGRKAPYVLKGVLAPLYLMPEEAFDAEFGSLRLKAYDGLAKRTSADQPRGRSVGLGGKAADVSEVMDGLR